MTIKAKFDGACNVCGGLVREGDAVNWAKGQGVSHVTCPAIPEPVPARFSFSKDDVSGAWGVRVQDPQDAQEYEGETVVVTAKNGPKAGIPQSVKLGAMLAAKSGSDCIYAIAKETAEDQEDLPVVPNGFYAVDVAGVNGGAPTLYLVKVVEFRNGTVHVFDADDRNRAYDTKMILEAIDAAGAGECAIAYGRLRGVCARCGSGLENRLSVELGIGPVCGKHYFATAVWSARKAAARDKIRADGFDPAETVRSAQEVQ